ncbi:MAG: sigma-70 family RNA polymerase sigma factor, partial [Actinomycetota bacterium]
MEERLHRALRDDCPRILSVLAARFGDLDLADEAVQDALVDAARTWPQDGVPANVGGWLMTTARRRALDRIRSAKRAKNRFDANAHLLDEQREAPDVRLTDMINEPDHDGPDDQPATPPGEEDERLRLLLLCCHPALDSDTQVALTLRLVGGLTTAEISAAFLVPEPTLAQRIVRAKKKIKAAGIPLSIPEQFTDRLGVVLAVLYLIFNEGYLSHDDDQDPIRPDLVDESIRLTRLVSELAATEAEPLGLLALQLFHRSRHSTRIDALGHLVLLDEQDRTACTPGHR